MQNSFLDIVWTLRVQEYPFGLKNAPVTFQRLMNSVLTKIQGLKCSVYLDDIVIYGPSLEEHDKRLVTILSYIDYETLN